MTYASVLLFVLFAWCLCRAAAKPAPTKETKRIADHLQQTNRGG